MSSPRSLLPSNFPDLRRILLTVIDSGEVLEQEFSMDSGRYLMRITPYLGEFARPEGAMLTFVDLSSVQRTERALKESNTTLQAVLDNVFDGIIVADEKGTIESINAAAESIFGYSPKEAVGQNVTLLQPEPYRSEHDDYLRNYLETGQAKIIGITREVSGRHKRGHTFPINLAVAEIQVFGQTQVRGYYTGSDRAPPGPTGDGRNLSGASTMSTPPDHSKDRRIAELQQGRTGAGNAPRTAETSGIPPE